MCYKFKQPKHGIKCNNEDNYAEFINLNLKQIYIFMLLVNAVNSGILSRDSFFP